jgi:hypothetical protein
LAEMRRTADALQAGALSAAEWQLDRPHPAFASSPNFSYGHLAQLFTLRRLQGRVDELIDALAATADDPAAPTAWRAAAAVGLAEAGRAEAARAVLHQTLDDRHRLARDWLWLGAVVHLAEAASALDDVDAAAVLCGLLRPFATRVAVLAH